MKCAIYIRVSKNCEEQKASLQNQKELFINYASEKDWDIYDFYVDIKSGSKMIGRKNLEKMICDAKEKRFDIILAKELSRLARNGKLSYEIKDVSEKNNIHIITLDGAINTLTGDVSKFGLYTWLYENEAQTIANRIKYSLDTKAKRGEFKGSIPPYGYHLKNSKLFINQDQTPLIVKRIFSEYLNGVGYDTIAKNLFKEKIITPSQYIKKKNASNIWYGSTIRKILTNENYTGDLVQSKTKTKSVTSTLRYINKREDYIIVPNNHEAIISKELFNSVQQLIASRTKIKAKSHIHLFSNLLFCADCGQGMHFKKNRHGYVCGAYDKRGKVACTDHIIRENILIEIIKNDLISFSSSIKNKKYVNKIKKELYKEYKIKEKEITKSKLEIQNLKDKKKNIINLLLNKTIEENDYKEYISSINNDIKNYKLKIDNLKYLLSSQSDINNINKLKQIEKYVTNFSKLTPEILNIFIEKIEIKKDGSPKIYYRFLNPFQCINNSKD